MNLSRLAFALARTLAGPLRWPAPLEIPRPPDPLPPTLTREPLTLALLGALFEAPLYRPAGGGERGVVIALRGGGAPAWTAWPWIEALTAQGVAVLSPDLDGHGANPRPYTSLAAAAEIVPAALAALATRGVAERVALLGASLGGAVALKALGASSPPFPAREGGRGVGPPPADSAASPSSPPFPLREGGRGVGPPPADSAASPSSPPFPAREGGRGVGPSPSALALLATPHAATFAQLLTPRLLRSLWEDQYLPTAPLRRAAPRPRFAVFRNPLAREGLLDLARAASATPLLLVHGQYDPFAPARQGQDFARAHGAATAWTVPTGHAGAMYEPDVVRRVAVWLATQLDGAD